MKRVPESSLQCIFRYPAGTRWNDKSQQIVRLISREPLPTQWWSSPSLRVQPQREPVLLPSDPEKRYTG